MKNSIKKEKIFNHPIDKIWNAITNAEEISTWFLDADFKAEVGYRYTFNSKGEECSPIIGEVKSATPYIIAYSWIIKDMPEISTLVTWTLENTIDGTKLTLVHSDISNYAGETAITMFESFNGGWDNCINGLLNYLKQEVNAG